MSDDDRAYAEIEKYRWDTEHYDEEEEYNGYYKYCHTHNSYEYSCDKCYVIKQQEKVNNLFALEEATSQLPADLLMVVISYVSS
jgi:hypothetical protein